MSLVIVVARAFTTSQSTAAHDILFRLIFSIVEKDTSQPLRFCHIDGDGINTFMADGYKGQALGQSISQVLILLTRVA